MQMKCFPSLYIERLINSLDITEDAECNHQDLDSFDTSKPLPGPRSSVTPSSVRARRPLWKDTPNTYASGSNTTKYSKPTGTDTVFSTL